jgi:cobalamin transport system substrate-binding protein
MKVSDEDGNVGSGKPPASSSSLGRMFYMRRIALLTVLLIVAACATSSGGTNTIGGVTTTDAADTTTTAAVTSTVDTGFPVTVTDAVGEVEIVSRPISIVSLSSTGTEMLFAIGAGDQVVAVDEFSTYPEEAPVTDLSGFTPNIEAIVGYEPDLVVISFDPGDLQSGLAAVGVPSLLLPTASTLDDSYTQLEVLGTATGNPDAAAGVVAGMQADIDAIVDETDLPPVITFYHEVDATLYSASSSSFIGQIYGLLGMENIADEADTDGSGFPQLSSEYVVSKDPDLIFLADVDYGVTVESIAVRPGWDGLTAVAAGAVIPLDSYLASNWGPRVVELLQTIADAAMEVVPVS